MERGFVESVVVVRGLVARRVMDRLVVEGRHLECIFLESVVVARRLVE